MFSQVRAWRIGDYYARLCPSCHRVGQVGIYPGRAAEALAFISRRDWVCRWCEDLQREVDDARFVRGEEDGRSD